MSLLDRYLVELTPRGGAFDDIRALGARSRAASAELSRSGRPVRFLRAVFVPEDDNCFLLFEGASGAAVAEVCKRAAIGGARISQVRPLGAPELAESPFDPPATDNLEERE